MASVSAPPWSSILTLGAVLFCTDHERNAATHALMSLLSMASVTFGDAVGESNKTLLMQLCRSDGMLLKADRPATAIDADFAAELRSGPARADGAQLGYCGRWRREAHRSTPGLR